MASRSVPRTDVRVFAEGAIRGLEEGKPDFVETSSPWADWRYAQYMTKKKKLYGPGNFKKGIPCESYLSSLLRHVIKLRALEDCKKYGLPVEEWMEPKEDHPAAIRFNTDGFMHEEEVDRAKARQIENGLA